MKLLPFLICFLYFSCSNKPDNSAKNTTSENHQSDKLIRLKTGDDVYALVCQNWIVKDATPPREKDLEAFGENTHGQPALSIFSDSSIVENPLGQDLRPGKFKFSERVFNVSFEDGEPSSYTIKRITPTELSLRRKENGLTTEMVLTAEGFGYKDPKENPFHPDNIRWRIKPDKREDDNALLNRLKNYMQFYIRFFNDVVNREASTLDTGLLPCCFNWYKGGITIQSEKHLDEKWIDCFYSRDQALKARDLLEIAVLRKHKWDPNIDNWVEQTVPILKSIRDSL